jgi:hypothetical protein
VHTKNNGVDITTKKIEISLPFGAYGKIDNGMC